MESRLDCTSSAKNRRMHINLGIVSRLWKADWHLSFLLGLLLLVIFVFYPMSDRGFIGGIVLQGFLSIMLISGVTLFSTSRMARALVLLLAVGTAAMGWIDLYTHDRVLI